LPWMQRGQGYVPAVGAVDQTCCLACLQRRGLWEGPLLPLDDSSELSKTIKNVPITTLHISSG